MVKEETGPLGSIREVLRKSTDFLMRIIAPVDGMGGVNLSYVCPHCNSFPLEDFLVGGRSSAIGGVQSVEKSMNREHPTGFL